jgi:hypothetical protein
MAATVPPTIRDEDSAERGYACDVCPRTRRLRFWARATDTGTLRCLAHPPTTPDLPAHDHRPRCGCGEVEEVVVWVIAGPRCQRHAPRR